MKIGYARVSTEDQDTRLQLDALKREGCKRIYEEKASGSKVDRPELQKLLDAAREGDVVIVWKLDRLGRSLKDLITIVSGLKEKGIGFRSLTETIDTTSSGGRLIFHIFASLAEFERSIISDRTKAGLAAARARGRKGGRKPKLNDGDIARIKTLAEARKTDGMYEHTLADIARSYRVSPMTLWRALKKSSASTCASISSKGKRHKALLRNAKHAVGAR
jgi:DNA invertase Pin-like site-specific DNA recombinase